VESLPPTVDDGARSCGATGQFRWNRRNVRGRPCAPGVRGHRTSPTPSGNGRRDSSKVRVRTTKNQLAGGASRRLDDEVAGAGADGQSIGSVISTDHLKGPCDSYSQGPFAHFRARFSAGWFRGSLRSHLNHRFPNPAQLWGSGRFLWTMRVASVDDQVSFGGTRRMFRKGLAHLVREGIELLSRPPATGGGTARRRRSIRERTGLPGRDRGGEMTTTPGPEEKGSRPGASSVPVSRRALGTHTLEGPSPISGAPVREIRNRLTGR